MQCTFCQQHVYGHNGTTIIGIGPAHSECLANYHSVLRIFKGMSITQLTDAELLELQEMVLSERNSRDRQGQAAEIEFF